MTRGDPSLLFAAVGNRLNNALKFAPCGSVVTVRSFARADMIGIEVIDSGPGIPPEERDAVLKRFYRTEASRHTPGSGLGPALAAAVARQHGMELTIGDACMPGGNLAANPGCRIAIARREMARGNGQGGFIVPT
ncbi:MAG: ATP-binding protein [Acetobacteraceae bacterium]|nr:ATP-binding protein [Acetobacteraceae bacterium]